MTVYNAHTTPNAIKRYLDATFIESVMRCPASLIARLISNTCYILYAIGIAITHLSIVRCESVVAVSFADINHRICVKKII